MQNQLSMKLDDEFKMFLRFRGFNIDSSIFQIKFNPPQNFASYKQAELDAQRVSVFGQVEQMPYISKRFAMERFLGLTEEEIRKNEELWDEESQKDGVINVTGKDLRAVGVNPADIESDIINQEDLADTENIDNFDQNIPPGIAPTIPPVTPAPTEPAL